MCCSGAERRFRDDGRSKGLYIGWSMRSADERLRATLAMVASPRVPPTMRFVEWIASFARATIDAAPERGDERQSCRARHKLRDMCRAELPMALTSHRQLGSRTRTLATLMTDQASPGTSRLGAATLVDQRWPGRMAERNRAMSSSQWSD